MMSSVPCPSLVFPEVNIWGSVKKILTSSLMHMHFLTFHSGSELSPDCQTPSWVGSVYPSSCSSSHSFVTMSLIQIENKHMQIATLDQLHHRKKYSIWFLLCQLWPWYSMYMKRDSIKDSLRETLLLISLLCLLSLKPLMGGTEYLLHRILLLVALIRLEIMAVRPESVGMSAWG